MQAICVLGLDVSLRSTGYGVLAVDGSRLSALDFGTLGVPAGRPLTECLRRIHGGVDDLIEKWGPESVAVEGGFFHRNAGTAMILGAARGAAISACACRGIAVYEYAPRKIKQAVVGFGAAAKNQVAQMVMRMLSMDAEPPADAGDALAVAICHAHGRSGHRLLAPEPI
jgi:crossover junction endodeoxyribonuclease RuvC